ncbi:MAG TPA: enoyl-CoA hydratase/isomerase family protein, partial [Bacteroidetes bacterium]|nr:enoyl-CoA hydratase/isomerase family protein [Bacteroidota bacterium]
GGTQRLPRLIGTNKALELMITGKTLMPAEALALGMINNIFPADELMEQTEKFASRLASGATRAIGDIKKAVYRGMELNLQDGLALERELVGPLFDSSDAQEGLSAFVEKRKPKYTGK